MQADKGSCSSCPHTPPVKGFVRVGRTDVVRGASAGAGVRRLEVPRQLQSTYGASRATSGPRIVCSGKTCTDTGCSEPFIVFASAGRRSARPLTRLARSSRHPRRGHPCHEPPRRGGARTRVVRHDGAPPRAHRNHRERASGARARKVHGGSQADKRVFADCEGSRKYLKSVRSRRLELPHPCGYQNLNLARLPVPPRPRRGG
jgi:hypothetical protein